MTNTNLFSKLFYLSFTTDSISLHDDSVNIAGQGTGALVPIVGAISCKQGSA